MSTEFWVQMLIYGATLGTAVGAILTRLKYMEKKIDKHNGLIDRMYKAEGRLDKHDALLEQLEK